MSTDFTGSRLFFSTELSQAGTTQPDYGKAFIADENGIRPLLIYNRDVNYFSGIFQGSLETNYYHVDGLDLSSDGTYLSVMALKECTVSAGLCANLDKTTIYNNRGETVLTGRGHLALSPNGKWALGIEVMTTGGVRYAVYNVVTGQQDFFVGGAANNRDWRLHGIADDGTAVVSSPEELILFRPPNFRQSFPVQRATIVSASINSAGSSIVWEQVVSGNPLNHILYVAAVRSIETR
jgi:hypothetical protein